MNCKEIYLDNAASTEISKTVKDSLIASLETYGNPSSIHAIGQKAHDLIQRSTMIIAYEFGIDIDEIYYTTGATMSNNLLIQGWLRANPNGKVVVSSIEHNDIAMMSEYFGFQVVPVDKNGRLDLEYLSELLDDLDGTPVLCSIQWANSECGVIQNMQAIEKIVHSHKNMWLHTDATQYVPYFRLGAKVDSFSMSGQKINCIKGIGLLYINKNMKVAPMIFGEQGLIGGTENVCGIAALGTAIGELSNKDCKELIRKRDYFINKLGKENIIGDLNYRLPNNIYVRCNVPSDTMVVQLDNMGIYCSAGSACSSSNEVSHVVLAMGYSEEVARNCVRFTINDKITYDEIDYVVEIFNYLNKERRRFKCIN